MHRHIIQERHTKGGILNSLSPGLRQAVRGVKEPGCAGIAGSRKGPVTGQVDAKMLIGTICLVLRQVDQDLLGHSKRGGDLAPPQRYANQAGLGLKDSSRLTCGSAQL